MTNIYPSSITRTAHIAITRTFQPLTATYPASIVATPGTAITTLYLHTATT